MATAAIQNVGYKIDLDDTTPIVCTFEATETNGDHIVRFKY